jgi:glycyl-tRNA synthetase beta subunit
MSDFVLEVGVENVPASYLPPAIAQLAADAAAMLERARLVYKEIYTTATPRRLVLLVSDLADRQTASEELVTGPPTVLPRPRPRDLRAAREPRSPRSNVSQPPRESIWECAACCPASALR